MQLVDLLGENAAAVRAGHPPGRPATSADGCRPTGQVATKAGSDTEATR
jgi:hypothetical protein